MSDAILQAEPIGRRPRSSLLIALAGAVLAVGLMMAALSSLAAALSRPVAPAPAPAAPRPTWMDIPKPVQIFSLQAAALEGRPLVYSARRLTTGEIREDVLAFGAIGGDAPALRLNLLRRRAGPTRVPLFAALAREAADVGLAVERSGLPDLMTTRFGRFETAEVTLAGQGAPGLSAGATCSGFRLALTKPELSITGLACGTVARGNLGCLIDRLDLASAGEDRALIDFFAATELTRNVACKGMRLGPDEAHAAWLDDKPDTPPKSRKSLRRR